MRQSDLSKSWRMSVLLETFTVSVRGQEKQKKDSLCNYLATDWCKEATPTVSSESFPEMPAQQLLYAPFSLQGCESSSENEEAVTSFRLPKSQCKVCKEQARSFILRGKYASFWHRRAKRAFFPPPFWELWIVLACPLRSVCQCKLPTCTLTWKNPTR